MHDAHASDDVVPERGKAATVLSDKVRRDRAGAHKAQLVSPADMELGR
jgi:hypothetical protein